jgi:quercetin dioxygenase-like cupin family protein
MIAASAISHTPTDQENPHMPTSTGNEIRVGQVAIRYLLEGAATGGALAVFEFDVPAGAKVPIAHSHDGYEETIYGLEGVLTWTLAGQQQEIGPGQVLCIPRGVVHRFDNASGADTRMLAIVTPGVLKSDFFREMAGVIAAATGGPPSPAALGEVMRRHGLSPAP